MLFSVWDSGNYSLSWDEVEFWAEMLGIETVPVIYRGIFDQKIVEKLACEQDPEKTEGFVIRNEEAFHFDEFTQNMGKYVRVNHVQTDKHWPHQQIIPNCLKENHK